MTAHQYLSLFNGPDAKVLVEFLQRKIIWK